ncbi:MAG: hypothetical protein A3F54_04955 [Candidatus Kerfeldbacteria bacterium RIFCSPHIGHO2_12_FULL_48_17]|uniref:Metallo-beta-lactamase domain-containing protein n=1 Tax=Candidatus Kerfeldbacteria bacterium RIFCSPHIGHO2_12_FULL_48_17 TaxID=1798542 RepID=A0A1G2B3G0_9BACT|nr:MAG: hypothetical protein A3F54_04955 [Candidatus Kerfeldbacteria bacterium RIFCSPHIGHO2_12_FULL_48_17]
MLRKLFFCLGFATLLFGAYFWRQQAEVGRSTVVFMNVGQGDGIYVRTPSGDDIVIDTGPDLRVVHELGRQMPFYDHDIELLVVTHPDADHITGATEILRRYTVRQVVVSGKVSESAQYRAFMEEVAAGQVPLVAGRAGQVWQFGDVRFDVLYPFDDRQVEAMPPNDTTVIMHMFYGAHTFLFTGDASSVVEDIVVARYGWALRSEVLKVGHHGSKTSSSEVFLRTVAPQVAVIQSETGNQFGHPHAGVLDRLDAIGAQILRNDELGAIVMRCDVDVCELEQ